MEAYAAIRKHVDDGREWIDIDTASVLLTKSGNKAQHGDRECGPQWAKDNPVVRIVKVTITEGETVFPM